MKELPKVYDPKQVEKKIYDMWLEGNYFHAERDPEKKPFTIVIPPPNVTGQLHLGHAFDETIQDILIRYKRMDGYSTLWLPGYDHAGIATQIKVEEKLRNEGKTRFDLGREGFLDEVWAWKNKFGNRIVEQLKTLGSSCDWARQRFTMDDTCAKAVRETFVNMYEKGLIYKGHRIINWCPHCTTALSDAEVEYVEKPGHLWHVRYPLSDGSGELIIATTRPETMLGDTGVAVNPADERYKDIVGKTCILPLVDREIPIVADEYVEMDFGTGCVKMTPCHDPNDFEVAQRHGLEEILILDNNARIINGGKYNGMDRYEARKAIVEDLEREGYLVKVEDYSHNVGTCYRCHNDVEPMSSEQWFVKMEPLAKEAIRVVEDGEVKFVPERFTKTYLNWMYNVRDWCISRQLWWGHRIPRLVLQRLRPHDRQPRGRRRVRALPQQEHRAGPRRAGHLVLLRSLALLHPGLAGRHRGPALLLPHGRAGHRLRHHLLLGGAHDLLRLRADAQAALPHRAHTRPHPRPAGQEDEQVRRQRRGPHRDD